MTFAEKLTAMRQARGMTQYRLAKTADVPFSTIHHIEKGKRDTDGLTLSTVRRLAKGLGVSVSVLLED